jgi:hypothetical protein
MSKLAEAITAANELGLVTEEGKKFFAEYAKKAISCLEEQLVGTKTAARKRKLEHRINEWKEMANE